MAFALALVTPVAAAGGAGRGQVDDPAGDEATGLPAPVGLPTAALSCHDPSIDIVSVAAAVHRKTLRIEVQHAAPVLAPALACSGVPLAAAGQTYGITVQGAGDSYLLLNVDDSGACLYLLFIDPVQNSDCLEGGQADGAAIVLTIGLRGTVAVAENATRAYQLDGVLAIHATAEEHAGARPGPGLPFVPAALMWVEDHGDTDLLVTAGH
jgi:hypothetical protein